MLHDAEGDVLDDGEAIQLISIWLSLSCSPRIPRAEHLAKEGR